MVTIWRLHVNPFVDRIVKVKLWCPLQSFLRPIKCVHLDMYVNSSALIPAWINCSKSSSSIIVCQLISTKIYLSISASVLNTWIDSLRIGMPNVYLCSIKRNTWSIVYVIDVKYKTQWNPFLHWTIWGIWPDVGTIRHIINKIWAFDLLRRTFFFD